MKNIDLKNFPEITGKRKEWPWYVDPELNEGYSEIDKFPKVSIVMPSFNQGDYIEESIRSVLLQNYPNIELIIIDGGSTDNSIEIIKKYERYLKYWVSEHDNGQSQAINKGLAKCNGELFNWQNADDILTKDCISNAVKAFIEYPHISFTYGYRYEIDKNSKFIKTIGENNKKNKSFSPTLTEALSSLQSGCQPGCLMRLQLVKKLNGIDENLDYIMDIDIHLRLLLVAPCLFINVPMVYYRVHENVKTADISLKRANERLFLAKKIIRMELFKEKKLSFLKWSMYASAYIFSADVLSKGKYFFKPLTNLILAFILPYKNISIRKKIIRKIINLLLKFK